MLPSSRTGAAGPLYKYNRSRRGLSEFFLTEECALAIGLRDVFLSENRGGVGRGRRRGGCVGVRGRCGDISRHVWQRFFNLTDESRGIAGGNCGCLLGCAARVVSEIGDRGDASCYQADQQKNGCQ